MVRIARVIAPDIPHHVTQRGNRRQRTFFGDEDFQAYLEFLFVSAKAFEFQVWSYCLMPNHVHLLVVPATESSLRDGISQVHQSYTRLVNRRQEWTGHLWQGRFFSCPIDPLQASLVARYIELNPVRGGLCQQPRQYRWSSADQACRGAHGKSGFSPLLCPGENWEAFLLGGLKDQEFNSILRKSSATGRPLGSEKFVQELESDLGRKLTALSPGRKCQTLGANESFPLNQF